MKLFLLILISPFFLEAQTYSQEIDSLFALKKYDQAIQKIEIYLLKTPKDLELLELIGDAYGFKSEWNLAGSYYKILTDTDAANARYFYKYGGVLGKLAKEGPKLNAISLISKVKTLFHKAAALDSMYIEARWALVELYTQLPGFLGGSYKKALRYADELEQISALNGYFSKAYIYQESDQMEDSKLYYTKGLERLEALNYFNDDSSDISHLQLQLNSIHFLIANGCVLTNSRLKVAQRYIQDYIRLFSSRDTKPLEDAYLLQSQIFKHQGQLSDALFSVEKALVEAPDFKPALKEKQLILLLKP